MMSKNNDHQDQLNRINADIRKAQIALENIQKSRIRDIERVEHRYDLEIQRLQATLKGLIRKAEQEEQAISRQRK
jgi:hypothetical protein